MNQGERTSQEQASQANSLPDTQNADLVSLTLSQDVICQQPTLTVWGRLCPLRSFFPTIDMSGDAYTLGRADTCNIQITLQLVHAKWFSVISKKHFRIYRECINNTNETVVYLEDLSQNGTYIDEIRVGYGKRVIIDNNSKISLSKSLFTVYRFENILKPENNNLPLELRQKYALGRKLGSGACGEVRLIFTKDGTKQFAIKTIQKCDFNIKGADNQLNDPIKINEVDILRKLKHPFIIQMKDIHDSPKTIYIVLELMRGGELFERIRNQGKLSESLTKLIFYQVILAICYLHKQDITHRDLKPENILLADNSDITVAKVSDFGLAKLVDAKTMMKTFCGTPMYVAPEILNNLGRISYTSQVDVWSLGVILYTCLAGVSPFDIQNKIYSLEMQIKKGIYFFPKTYFGHVSKEAVDLIKHMMTVDPSRRITVPQILQHSWLKDSNIQRTLNSLIFLNNDENISPEVYSPPKKRVRHNT